MAHVVLFHHVQGLTDGVLAFAQSLSEAGHWTYTPDLFDGARPGSIDDGLALVETIGSEVLGQRTEWALADLPRTVVYAGFSFGAGTAQRLAQTEPSARGALLYESCLPISGDWAVGPWPGGMPVQIHGMESDRYFALEGDIYAARDLVATVGPELAQLYLYPGDRHLFCDSSLPSYDPDAAELALQRSVEFLDRIG